MKKTTEDLIHEITACTGIENYLDANKDEFLDATLPEYLQALLAQTQLKVSQVAARSQKGDYVYQIFRGVKNPGRDMLLCIALAMGIDLDEVKQLLRIAHLPYLDARNRRDSILIFAINRKLAVPETNDILYELNEDCL